MAGVRTMLPEAPASCLAFFSCGFLLFPFRNSCFRQGTKAPSNYVFTFTICAYLEFAAQVSNAQRENGVLCYTHESFMARLLNTEDESRHI